MSWFCTYFCHFRHILPNNAQLLIVLQSGLRKQNKPRKRAEVLVPKSSEVVIIVSDSAVLSNVSGYEGEESEY